MPASSPSFADYSVTYYPGVGICTISATSTIFEGDQWGRDVRAAVDKTAAALSAKYGQPSSNWDQCVGTCDPQFWTMHIDSGSRMYGHGWEPPTPISGVRSAALIAKATNSINSYMALTYTLADEDLCASAAAKQEAGNL